MATVLYRERHAHIIAELQAAGIRIKLINDGDIAGAINTAFDKTGVDILFGSGGCVKDTYAETQSIVMRAKSGTVRFIDGCHSLNKKPNLVIKP